MQEPSAPFVVAFVAGVSPDKWSKRWRERYPESPLELTIIEAADQLTVLRDGRASMSFVRLPVERDGLHVIPLYEELSVAVVSVEDDLSLHEEVTVADLAGHQLVTDPSDLPGWSSVATVERLPYPAMGAKDAVEVVASSEATVAVLPMSVARLHHRKDVVARPLTDGPLHPVGIAWRTDDEDPRIETFVGIVRGRGVNSSRGGEVPAAKAPEKQGPAKRSAQPARKPTGAKKAAAGRRTAKSGAKGGAKTGARTGAKAASKRGKRR
ncbi:LysR family substrate-binding domain-containing protein [Nocardioides sp.]|uniref:LysR family substrate-binding domain-containing protein n=1 Tax=Nocardioides sp. TaxID=35761 RepID=UPI002CF5B57E|nr:LysR substrate-binding domain-containing protein [Nocardioides sp.]HSX69095.1 LysR substrate-binding domain-containing protein [Nocardioides sp.]